MFDSGTMVVESATCDRLYNEALMYLLMFNFRGVLENVNMTQTRDETKRHNKNAHILARKEIVIRFHVFYTLLNTVSITTQ